MSATKPRTFSHSSRSRAHSIPWHLNMCFILLTPAQGTDPKKCDPRLLRRKHFEGSVPWAGVRKKKKRATALKKKHVFGRTAGEVEEGPENRR